QLRAMDKGTAAAEAAEAAQHHLARVRAEAERYLRLRVAAELLAREIERYRKKNEGPVLSRAGELLRRLTLGSLSHLKVGFDEANDDQPVIRCVRPGGAEVPIDGLSDGTRDQLYHALPLATLE